MTNQRTTLEGVIHMDFHRVYKYQGEIICIAAV